MLNSETKRHIDAARDVLVGKVPDPKSQVQEITNALVYKFMDDMDERSVSMGGKRRYFAGEYEKYSWRRIMDPKIGAHERIGLYTEALNRLSKNPNLPELFRGIFRNAYLPFNDGRTLTLFLNEINYFDYHNSEQLGNAYEYLLSIMGSQGDAGQFRTPRHIIDFIVEVVDPTKDDSVLDPACGTAGFLISAYKHVLVKHNGKDNITGENVTKEKPLTADEKRKLHDNYHGFDIDDNMVKMAQVNMYLHGFPDPKILVHDTLSSEDYWLDRYSVIMANPPFMTPKGGIVPHNKFGVKSNRAEVLFVDYIMNHLKPNGRAGIIVPEGIIFQSTTAHKQLRKNLLDDGLYAVVSLPSGVFNPYAGVKTSILFFDNDLAKQKSEILFIKISKEGYDLGAQRRPQCDENNDRPEWCPKHSDFPVALGILKKWRGNNKSENTLAIYVPKEVISKSGDYNLSSERYKPSITPKTDWPVLSLSEIAKLIRGVVYSKTDEVNIDGYQVLRANNINLDGTMNLDDIKFITKSLKIDDRKKLNKNDIFICLASGSKEHIGKTAYIDSNTDYYFGGFMGTLRTISDLLISKYLYYFLRDHRFNCYLKNKITGANINNLSSDILLQYKIPLPPLEIQQRIVSELDGYQNIINGARQVVDNWKPHIDIDPEWEKVKLGEVCEIKSGGTPPTREASYYENGDIPWLKSEVCKNEIVTEPKTFISKEGLNNSSAKWLIENSTLIALVGATIGKTALITFKATTNQNVAGLYPKKLEQINPFYLYFVSQTLYTNFMRLGDGGFKMANLSYIKNLEIPLPSLANQKQIVEKIEAERVIIDANKKLIAVYEQKIRDTIARLWSDKTD